jgi:hypothetical protein
MKKRLSRLRHRVQDFKINFKKKFKEYNKKPASKRKSFIVGFSAVVAIFGVTLFGPAFSAFAKDIPKVNPKPMEIAPVPAPPSIPPSSEIINVGLSGLAASVCSLAITSGSFAVGVACGCLVVFGILQVQGK